MARKNVQHPSVAGATGDWPIPHRKHPKKGWQSWNTPTADWCPRCDGTEPMDEQERRVG